MDNARTLSLCLWVFAGAFAVGTKCPAPWMHRMSQQCYWLSTNQVTFNDARSICANGTLTQETRSKRQTPESGEIDFLDEYYRTVSSSTPEPNAGDIGSTPKSEEIVQPVTLATLTEKIDDVARFAQNGSKSHGWLSPVFVDVTSGKGLGNVWLDTGQNDGCKVWSYNLQTVATLACNETARYLCVHDGIAKDVKKRHANYFFNEPNLVSYTMCSLPNGIPYGSYLLLNGSTEVGHLAVYSCEPSYKLIGKALLTCTAAGFWDRTPPSCIRKKSIPVRCPALFIENGEAIGIDHSDRRPGSRALIRCKKGFDLDGERVLRCLDSGLWNSTLPSCQQRNGAVLLQGRDLHQDDPAGRPEPVIVKAVDWGTVIGGAIGVTLLIICSTFLIMALLAKRRRGEGLMNFFSRDRAPALSRAPRGSRNGLPPIPPHSYPKAQYATPQLKDKRPRRPPPDADFRGFDPGANPDSFKTTSGRKSPEGHSSDDPADLLNLGGRVGIGPTTIYVASEDVQPQKNGGNDRRSDVVSQTSERPVDVSPSGVNPVRRDHSTSSILRTPQSKQRPLTSTPNADRRFSPRRAERTRSKEPPQHGSLARRSRSQPRDFYGRPYERQMIEESIYVPYSSSSSHYSATDTLLAKNKKDRSRVPIYYSLPRQHSRSKLASTEYDDSDQSQETAPRKTVRFEEPLSLRAARQISFSDSNLGSYIRKKMSEKANSRQPPDFHSQNYSNAQRQPPSSLKHVFHNEHYNEFQPRPVQEPVFRSSSRTDARDPMRDIADRPEYREPTLRPTIYFDRANMAPPVRFYGRPSHLDSLFRESPRPSRHDSYRDMYANRSFDRFDRGVPNENYTPDSDEEHYSGGGHRRVMPWSREFDETF